MKQRPQHLAEAFRAHGWHVYYCENHPSCDDLLTTVAPRLWLVRDKEHLVRRVLPDAPRPLVLWHSRPKGSRKLSAGPHDLEIYDCLDEFPRGESDERRLVQRVDLVIASSARLAERMRLLHPRVTLVRNACDYDLFHGNGERYRGALPVADVCYVGAIASWVDVGLLGRLSDMRPDLRFRCVGPVLRSRRKTRLPSNVEMTGHVAHREIPGLLAHASVGIVPFGLCPTALSADPVKIYEYLAAGVPVVSTPIPEAARWGELVKLASDAQGFSEAIDQVREGDSPGLREARQAAARSNTWLHRFRRISAVIRQLLPPPPASLDPGHE